MSDQRSSAQPPTDPHSPDFPVDLRDLPPLVLSVLKEDQTDNTVPPSMFYVPPASSKQSQPVSFRGVDPAVVAAYQRLAESGLFGWDSSSDGYRWALEIGVQIAGKTVRDERFSNELRVLRALMRRHQGVERERTFLALKDYLVRDVAILLDEGARGDARVEFRRALEEVESLSIESIKEKMLNHLVAAFPMFWAEVCEERARTVLPTTHEPEPGDEPDNDDNYEGD